MALSNADIERIKELGFNFVTADDLKNIWEKYDGRCYYCNTELNYHAGFNGLHIEHVVNGLNKIENLVLSCPRCNNIKKNTTPDELENMAKKIRDFIKENNLNSKESYDM